MTSYIEVGPNMWSPEDAPDRIICGRVGATLEETLAEMVEPEPDPLADAKAALNATVTAKREAVFAAGFSPPSGPLAGHTLQCRDVQDRTNWLTSAVGYSAAVQAGHGAVAGATFRTANNETVVVTFAQAVSILLSGMQMWGQAIMQRSWDLKDQIEAAEDEAAVQAIDIETGWP